MSLLTQLNDDLKAALKGGADIRKTTLRAVLAGAKQALLDKRQAKAKQLSKGGELTDTHTAALDQLALDDADVLSVLQKEAKARREAIADAHKAHRADLVAAAETELAIIEAYLPKALTRDELVDLTKAAIAEAGATDPQQQGAVMKLLTPRTKGRADGKQVSDLVRELLSHR
jgi:hypothetical protein